jgi:hypothetical protein
MSFTPLQIRKSLQPLAVIPNNIQNQTGSSSACGYPDVWGDVAYFNKLCVQTINGSPAGGLSWPLLAPTANDNTIVFGFQSDNSAGLQYNGSNGDLQIRAWGMPQLLLGGSGVRIGDGTNGWTFQNVTNWPFTPNADNLQSIGTNSNRVFRMFIGTGGILFNQFQGGPVLYANTGAPGAFGNNGDFYLRSDTPGTANQRLYVKSAGAWVGII